MTHYHIDVPIQKILFSNKNIIHLIFSYRIFNNKEVKPMTETYKYKSKITTAISFLAGLIVYLGKDELAKIMPPEWAYLASIIVLIAGYIATQKTENIRVDVAEQIMLEKFAKLIPLEENDPTADYENQNVTINDADGEENDY